MRRSAALIVVLASLSFHPGDTKAQSNQPLSAVAVSYGIRISLAIPRRVYPRNALVRFTVTLQNVSRNDRYLQDWQPDWGGRYSPHILMRTPTGRLIYEEELATFLAPTAGNYTDDYVLHPGDTLTRQVRFVLQAQQVQAVARVLDGYSSFRVGPGVPTPAPSQWAKHLWRVSTPFASLDLTDEPAPTVAVSRLGRRMVATVHSRVPVSGQPLFMDSIRCWTGKSTMWTNQHQPWTAVRGDQFSTLIYSHCPSRQPWHAVVGWPNHRVALIDIADVARIR